MFRAGREATQLEGDDVYDDMILTATCFIADPAQIPAIAAWLKGKGTVTFANRTGGHYNARIANQIPFEKVLRGNPHCSFAVNFRCYPFWYQENVSDVTITTSSDTITTPGTKLGSAFKLPDKGSVPVSRPGCAVG